MADSSTFSVRFPNEVLEQIRELSKNKDISVNRTILLLLEYALKNSDDLPQADNLQTQIDDLRDKVEALEVEVREIRGKKR